MDEKSKTFFSLKKFRRFCDNLMIDTKEEHKPKPLGQFMGTQRYMLEEINKGLKQGKRTFILVKGRQQGVSTASLALADLYWPFMNEGMQGSLISDNGLNLANFRSILKVYYDNLPQSMRIPKVIDNVQQVVYANRSSVTYQVANKRQKGTLGRGIPTAFLHATEVSSWDDDEGLASLEASLAMHNPRRLYIFESTARGFNGFFDMWEAAQGSATSHPIFIGWWRNEYNQVSEKSIEYKMYWDGAITTDENAWIEDIKREYDTNLVPTQIAWYRWMLAEKIKDEMLMHQEYPHTAEYAFQMLGAAFFSNLKLRADYLRILSLPPSAQYYKYTCGAWFEETRLQRCSERHAELTVWAQPVDGAQYVAGCDPAYGSSEWADRHCLSVWRCYADKLVQVAEFNSDEGDARQFAWIVAHICGMYSNVLLNLEINGPGGTTFNELQNLVRIAGPKRERAKDMYDLVGNIRHYLYRRIDTMGSGLAYQTNLNNREKERMLGFFRSYFEKDQAMILSADLLREMQSIRRHEGIISAKGRKKDDRVMAAGYAVMAYNDKLMLGLIAEDETFEAATYREKEGVPKNMAQDIFQRALDGF